MTTFKEFQESKERPVSPLLHKDNLPKHYYDMGKPNRADHKSDADHDKHAHEYHHVQALYHHSRIGKGDGWSRGYESAQKEAKRGIKHHEGQKKAIEKKYAKHEPRAKI